ncbi:hypothetical protein JQK15_20100 [Sphingobium sp. BHU LFT2]|uniref:hypothetical protein n=1 Tax=Sphingobium sp. BHU LFT2 TaxID=2807634 RepID=UPI001BEA71B3|nr:hypothetical protein [Sphingobium sp. BHU LFT2]MBT2245820.1 hypothetical protein [Sphingobium sp. BHU LFT2]
MRMRFVLLTASMAAATPVSAASQFAWYLIGAAGEKPNRVAIYANGMSITRFPNPDTQGSRELRSVETSEVQEAGNGPYAIHYLYQVDCGARKIRTMTRERRWLRGREQRPPEVTVTDVRQSPWETPPANHARFPIIEFTCTPAERRDEKRMLYVTNAGEPVASNWNMFWRDSPRFAELVALSKDDR